MAPLIDVSITSWGMEYSIHGCPPAHKREIAGIFPGQKLEQLLIIPTCQHAVMDLVKTGEAVDDEKDRLLERFMAWARPLCCKLSALGFFSDYIDPCSGLPMVHQDSNQVFDEVASLGALMGYSIQNAGCCKIVLHPRWGSAVYPATVFTLAPVEHVLFAIREVEAELAAEGPAGAEALGLGRADVAA